MKEFLEKHEEPNEDEANEELDAIYIKTLDCNARLDEDSGGESET